MDKPVTFAQKQVVDVQTAAVQGLIIALAFGQNHVCALQKLLRMGADSMEPGAAYIAAVSQYRDKIRESAKLCIFHGGVVSSRQTAYQCRDPHIGKRFLQNRNGKLIQDDFAAVIGNLYNIGSFFHILAKVFVLLFIQSIFVFAFDKGKGSLLADLRKCCEIDVVAGAGID